MRTGRRGFLKGVAAVGLASGVLGAAEVTLRTTPSVQAREAEAASPEGDSGMDLTYVTYCGLYCKLCANVARIPGQASELNKTLTREGWDYFGDKELLKKLRSLCDAEKTFTGCRGGKCGDPACEIRKCASGRRVVVCSGCKDYPCDKIDRLAQSYPLLKADGLRQQEIGLENWAKEQEERAKTDFCYADIRLDPDRKKLKVACCGLDCGACDVKAEDCSGCQSHCSRQWSGDCKIRACCKTRNLDNCSRCADFACALVTAFEHDQYPHHKKAIEKLRKMRETGAT